MKKLFCLMISMLMIPVICFAGTISDIKIDKVLYQNKKLEYAFYLPDNLSGTTPVIVLVNGLNGRGEGMITQNWISFADTKGWPIMAPSFVFEGDAAFQNKTSYQYPKVWSGRALNAALKQLKTKGVKISGLYLMGFSACAQFAERYTLNWPKNVKKCALVASGGNDKLTGHLDTKFFYGIGEKDLPHRQNWAFEFKTQAARYNIPLTYKQYQDTGHNYTPEMERDIILFFGGQ